VSGVEAENGPKIMVFEGSKNRTYILRMYKNGGVIGCFQAILAPHNGSQKIRQQYPFMWPGVPSVS
jgi:hypothetical protein